MIASMDINEIANIIKKRFNDAHKPILIAIEGYGGSGKSTHAMALKQILPNSEIIRMDAFILKEKAQKADVWEEVFDRNRLEKQVLAPSSSGKTISYQKLDWINNKLGSSIALPNRDYLLIDGISSYHPNIEHYYSFKIWINTPIDIAKKRGQLRDSGNENAKLWDKWVQRDLEYHKKYHPEQRADFIVGNAEPKVDL